MLILVSGEGSTDMGVCATPVQQPCARPDFLPGPMAWIVDRLAERIMGYSFFDYESIRFISETNVARTAKKLRPVTLPGPRRLKETAYFERTARALAKVAQALAETSQDQVVGVLFRDADGTQSAERGEWQAKWYSMLRGFEMENFALGVPMVPKPKSEAWLLCALKPNQPYQHCKKLEKESGNDHSKNPLKSQLEKALGYQATREDLADKIADGTVDVFRILDMPSFSVFRTRFEFVFQNL